MSNDSHGSAVFLDIAGQFATAGGGGAIMRTLLIPLAFLAIYAAVLLATALVITPGADGLSDDKTRCLAAVHLGFPEELWRAEKSSPYGDERDRHLVPDDHSAAGTISQARIPDLPRRGWDQFCDVEGP